MFCVQSMFRVGCQDWLSRLVVKIVVIASSSASSVSVFGISYLLHLQARRVSVSLFPLRNICSTSSPLVVQGNPQLDSKSSHVWRSLLCTAASLPGVGTAGIKWFKVLLFQDMQKEYTLAPAYHCFPQKNYHKKA